MRRVLTIGFIIILAACASNTTNRVSKTNVSMSGGEYEQKSWDETLEFKRTSWYIGASLAYDIMIARLDKQSPFRYWLENNQEKLITECKDLYVALIYTNSMSNLLKLQSPAYIRKQITDIGFEEVTMASFQANMSAHNIFGQWHLRNHKFSGFCYKKMSSIPEQISISLPGFKTRNILKN